MNENMDFEAYIRQGEPDKKEKASIWQTAIGLQAVDGLKTSDYLMQTARKHIEGDTVNYLNFEDLCRAINYDLEQERSFSYKGISQDAMITHLSRFVSGLWQIHAFGEGNTRTTAVFTILYLRHIGFKVSNDMFAQHSWYFRNALVRSNYKNAVKGIDYSPVYLERFFRNLLLGEKWDLRNRYLHINPSKEWSEQPNLDTRTSNEQAPHKHPTSTPQVQDKLHTDDPNILRIVQAVGAQELSVKEIMDGIGLKDRKNVLNLYLNPAITGGYIRLLYPDKPRHPRQKYLLTDKGFVLYKQLRGE